MPRSPLALAALTLTGTLVLSGCASEDAADSESVAANEAATDAPSGSDNPLVQTAVTDYQNYVNDQADELAALTTTLTDAVRAGDLEAAQEAYAPSREPWERIEPIAGLIEELDGQMDSRVDAFASVEDPDFTGWHRLEYILFAQETTKGADEFADKLDADVAILQEELTSLEIVAADVPVGASELIEEVSLGKITGEEDRYSKTDLWDLNANVEGSEQAITFLVPALDEADPELASDIDTSFAELNETLEPLREEDGWQLYCVEDDEYPSDRCDDSPTIDIETIDALKAQTAALSEITSQAAGALGLSEN